MNQEANNDQGERRVNQVMRNVIQALHENNTDVDKLIQHMITAVNRMTYLICAATVAVVLLCVQLFLGLNAREMAVEASRQRAEENFARADLAAELHRAAIAVKDLQKQVAGIQGSINDMPRVQSSRTGGVVLSVPVDENGRSGKSVEIPLQPNKSRY